MGRIMAIDFGGKRTGLAVTDPMRIFATGLEAIATTELLDFIVDYTNKEEVDVIVFGLPIRMDGSYSSIVTRMKEFADELHKKLPHIEIDGVDESHTSQQAVQAMVQSGVPKKKRRDKGLIDKVSATLILQRYLEENNI